MGDVQRDVSEKKTYMELLKLAAHFSVWSRDELRCEASDGVER